MTIKYNKKTKEGFIEQKIKKAIIKGLNNANDFLYSQMSEYINIEDYTITQLKEAGHPYSTTKNTNSAKHPDEYINKQSGTLSQNMKKITVRFRGNKAKAQTYIKASDCPYIKYLVYGTEKMRPRNPFLATYDTSMYKAVNMVMDEIKRAK